MDCISDETSSEPGKLWKTASEDTHRLSTEKCRRLGLEVARDCITFDAILDAFIHIVDYKLTKEPPYFNNPHRDNTSPPVSSGPAGTIPDAAGPDKVSKQVEKRRLPTANDGIAPPTKRLKGYVPVDEVPVYPRHALGPESSWHVVRYSQRTSKALIPELITPRPKTARHPGHDRQFIISEIFEN